MALPDIDLSVNQKLIVDSLLLQLKNAKSMQAKAKLIVDAAKASLDAAEIEAAARQGVDLNLYKLSEVKGKFVDRSV